MSIASSLPSVVSRTPAANGPSTKRNGWLANFYLVGWKRENKRIPVNGLERKSTARTVPYCRNGGNIHSLLFFKFRYSRIHLRFLMNAADNISF